jgi:hypothetical protein
MMMIARIAWILAVSILPLGAAAQSDYPNKPIKMIVPLSAASAVDNAARILAQRMSTNMGQAIVVENQPGAAGLIGAERVAWAPDGYDRRLQRQHHDDAAKPLRQMAWDILRTSSRFRWLRLSNGASLPTPVPLQHGRRADRGGEGKPGQDRLCLRRQR